LNSRDILKDMKIWVIAGALLAAAPIWGDAQFRVRQTTRNDIPPGKGQCDIRLQVDNEADIRLHRDMVIIHTIAGRDPFDDGSECNAPLPDRDFAGFNFEVLDSRNEIRLVEPPNFRNDFNAVVHIRDSAGGLGRYHFRVSWALSSDAGPRSDRPRDFDDRRPEGPRGFAWNNTLHTAMRGRGEAAMELRDRRGDVVPLDDVTVDVDRGGKVIVSFRSGRNAPVTFEGRVIGWDNGQMRADVSTMERFFRVSGPMNLSYDRTQNVVHIDMEAFDGQHRLRLKWDALRR
jgi:hypothetical protein